MIYYQNIATYETGTGTVIAILMYVSKLRSSKALKM